MLSSKYKQIIISGLLIITIFICGYLMSIVKQLEKLNQDYQNNQEILSQNLSDMNNVNIESNKMVQDLTLELQKINSEKLELQNILNNTVSLDAFSKSKLKVMGYDDYALILNDLNNQNALIPFDGVLGGSMAWRPENSFLLNHQWVYATFDDGHIEGAALLTFKINDSKTIKWEVMDAFLND